MKALMRFGRFWYDFIVGDEWVIAVVVVLAVGATAIAARIGWNAWPLLPVAVAGTLAFTAWRAVRRGIQYAMAASGDTPGASGLANTVPRSLAENEQT